MFIFMPYKNNEAEISMNKIAKSEILAFIIASAMGTIFHFVYDLTNQNFIAGLFFPNSESTFEHLKLVFFPIIIVSFIEYFFMGIRTENFVCTKLFSAILGIISTVVIFYTFIGVYGKNVDFVNILIYFVAMAIAYIFSYKKLSSDEKCFLSWNTCAIIFAAMTLMFMILSVFPPDIGLFADPLG